MKTLVGVIALSSVLVIGCSNKDKEEELQKQLDVVRSEQTSMHQDIIDRDKYFEDVVNSVNSVYADLEKVRTKEAQLVERSGGPEGPIQFANADSRNRLIENINDIGLALKENRKKIADLQTRTKSFKGQIAGLNTLIGNLKQTLQEREQSIAQLEGRVQGLESSVAEKTKVLSEKEALIVDQQHRINTGYFVIGTRKELKEKGIITDEGGFLWGLLGSTTVMASGIDPSAFTPIDKTTDQTISVHGEIEEILPHRNQESFAMAQPVEDNSSLTILSPGKFWQDNYLVIVVD
jgi:predicted  nucleic acid-binding Zn-ribbon protein